MPWPFRRKPRNLISISDPIMVEFFGLGHNYSGVQVSELTALAVPAMWRATSLISGTLAGLPWRTVREIDPDQRQRVSSVFDDPGAVVGLEPFNWKETILYHLVLGGDSFLRHIRNQAGGFAGFQPIHPGCVEVEWDSDRPGGKRFTATLKDNTRQDFDATSMTQIMGPSLTGLRGMGLIEVARNSLGSAIAADRASARMFSAGPMVSGVLVPEEDVTPDEAKVIRASLDEKTTGVDNAGAVPVINRRLRFEKWGTSLREAQWLETRQFLIQEISRWTGVPASLLSDPGSVSTWGTGVEIQQRGLGRFTLAPWARRIEDPLSRLLAKPRFLEVDFAGLERGTPQEEIELLVRQVEAGLMTVNEARRIRNMSPVEGGDVLRGQSAPQPEAVPV